MNILYNLLVGFLRLFIKRTEFVLQEGQAKYRVRGVTIGIFFFGFCIVGAWKEDKKSNSVGVVFLNQGYRLLVEVTP